MIKTIKIEGLKGKSGEWSLKSFNLIRGRNFAGKTTITEGVKLAITGYLSELGKTPAATMQLASGNRLNVQAETAAGTFAREWSRNAAGKVKTERSVTPEGWENEDLLRAFSPKAFLALNQKQKVEILLSQAGNETGPKVLEISRELDFDEENEFRVLDQAFDSEDPKFGSPSEMLSEAEKVLIEARKTLKRELKATVEARKALIDAGNTDAPDKVTQEDLDERQKEISEVFEKITRTEERLNRARKNVQKNKDRRMALEKWSDEQEASFEELKKSVEEQVEKVRDFDQWKSDREKALEHVKSQSQAEQMQAEIEAFQEKEKPHFPYVGTVSEELGSAIKSNDLNEANLSRADRLLTEAINERNQVEKMKACPTCGGENQAFKESLIKSTEARIEQNEADKKRALDLLEEGQEKEAICLKMQDWLEQEKRTENLIGQLDLHLAGLKDFTLLGEKEEVSDETLREERALLESFRKTRSEYLAAKRMQEEPEDESMIANLQEGRNKLVDQKSELENLIAEDKRKRAIWIEHGTQQGEIEKAEKKAERLEKVLERAELLILKTREAKSETTAKILKPIQTGLDYFTKGILPSSVELSPELELSLGGNPWVTLSGSEQTIIAFALSAVFAGWSPLKIAIMDEASTMDDRLKVLFANRLGQALTEGILDQVFFIDHAQENGVLNALPEEVELNVIEIG